MTAMLVEADRVGVPATHRAAPDGQPVFAHAVVDRREKVHDAS